MEWYQDPTIQRRGVVLGTILSSIAAQAYLHHRLKDSLDKTPNLPTKKIPELYKSVGIDPKFPTVPIDKLDNAYYASPFDSKFMGKDVKSKFTPAILKKVKQLGHIGYDPKFNKAGILAHEAGHAAIRTTKPWYNPSRFNQSVLRQISNLTTPFAGSVGTIVGAGTESPLYGALAGLGSAALLGAPTLINESQATGYAKDYLNKSHHKSETKDKNLKALSNAYDTYAIGTLLLPTLLGGASGLWAATHKD
jgi:hypothetical protein